MEDLDLQEFLPKDDRLKADMLEEWGWDGHAPTICDIGRKTYPAREDKPEESKLQVFFIEFPGYALECNVTQTKKLMQILGERTSQWVGQKVVLLSIDTKTPQGQPAKTIQIKEYRAAPPAAPGSVAPPQAAQNGSPAPAAPMPLGTALPPAGDGGDPFDDENITAQQMSDIENLCQQLRRNPVLVSQNLYHKNPDQLTHSQAVDFLLRLKKDADNYSQGVAAVAR